MTAAKARKRKKAVLLISILVLLCVGLYFGIRFVIRRYQESRYPESYRDLVLGASKTYSIPPEKIFAVIKAESGFDEKAVSPAGAVGLMQILPETCEWLCRKRQMEYDPEKLTDPEFNIDFGCYFLNELYQSFQNWDLVHAAYNAGPNAVRRWMEDPALYQNGILISIPYPETKTYVERINEYEKNYIELYQSKGW